MSPDVDGSAVTRPPLSSCASLICREGSGQELPPDFSEIGGFATAGIKRRPSEKTCRSSPPQYLAPGPSPKKLRPGNGTGQRGDGAAEMAEHTSTNVCIHATLERSDSALKLRVAEHEHVKINTGGSKQSRT